jgi:hypothetical protein
MVDALRECGMSPTAIARREAGYYPTTVWRLVNGVSRKSSCEVGERISVLFY